MAFLGVIICWQPLADRKSTAKVFAPLDKSLVAEGIAAEECTAGGKRASVQIETVRITGKKKGFLRLGFCKVLSCEGMIIDIYPPVTGRILRGEFLSPPLSGKNGTPGTVLSPVDQRQQVGVADRTSGETDTGRSAADDGDWQDFLGWKLALSCGISPFTVKGLEMKNSIVLRLHDQGRIILSLQSMRADFDPQRKSIVFEDAVRVVSPDGRMLETNRLEWLMEKGVLQTRQFYTFINDGRQQQGTRFGTDLYLRPLEPAAPAEMKRKET